MVGLARSRADFIVLRIGGDSVPPTRVQTGPNTSKWDVSVSNHRSARPEDLEKER